MHFSNLSDKQQPPSTSSKETFSIQQRFNNIKISQHAPLGSVVPMDKRLVVSANVPKGTFCTMTETFEANKLAYIVRNQDKFPQIVDAHHREDYDVFLIPAKYLANSHNGKKVVHYKYSGDSTSGRVYSHKSQSLQNITRQIRHTISRDDYDDVDMENAHPRILQHICKGLNIPTPELDRYIGDRNTIIARLRELYGVSRGAIKIAILALMNGGSKEYRGLVGEGKWDSWVTDFNTEVKAVHSALAKAFPEQYAARIIKRKAAGKDYNHKASLCNVLLCEMENNILQVMFEIFKKDCKCGPTGNNAVLCFDGIMIPKDTAIDASYLRNLEKLITAKFGIVIRLEKKSMDEHVELPADIPRYEPLMSEAWMCEDEIHDEFPYIYSGMPVMANVNNHRIKNGYLNNQEFVIEERVKGLIKLSGGVVVTLLELQRDFRPSYCVTAYKVQGSTINKPHMVHEFDDMFEYCGKKRNGQYVAITRTTDAKLLTIVRKSDETDDSDDDSDESDDVMAQL